MCARISRSARRARSLGEYAIGVGFALEPCAQAAPRRSRGDAAIDCARQSLGGRDPRDEDPVVHESLLGALS